MRSHNFFRSFSAPENHRKKGGFSVFRRAYKGAETENSFRHPEDRKP
jgi:hypothetical protein